MSGRFYFEVDEKQLLWRPKPEPKDASNFAGSMALQEFTKVEHVVMETEGHFDVTLADNKKRCFRARSRETADAWVRAISAGIPDRPKFQSSMRPTAKEVFLGDKNVGAVRYVFVFTIAH